MTNLFNNAVPRARKMCHVIFLLLLFALVVAWDKPASAASKPLAKVNGTVLTETDLEEALNEIMPAGVFHGGFSSKKRLQRRPQAFEKMIEKEPVSVKRICLWCLIVVFGIVAVCLLFISAASIQAGFVYRQQTGFWVPILGGTLLLGLVVILFVRATKRILSYMKEEDVLIP